MWSYWDLGGGKEIRWSADSFFFASLQRKMTCYLVKTLFWFICPIFCSFRKWLMFCIIWNEKFADFRINHPPPTPIYILFLKGMIQEFHSYDPFILEWIKKYAFSASLFCMDGCAEMGFLHEWVCSMRLFAKSFRRRRI